MILKVWLTERSRESIARIKSIRFPDSGGGIRPGYIVGLAAEETAALSENIWRTAIANMYPKERGEANSTSTSLSLRRPVYEQLCKAREIVGKLRGKDVPMSAVIELLLSMAANEIERMDAVHTLRVMEWNINGRSGYSPFYMPVTLIADQILKRLPHIFVLTEFVPVAGWSDLKALLARNFEIYVSPYQRGQNGICIGLRKNCGITFLSEEGHSFPEGPDFHRIRVRVNGVIISIMGTRIQVDSKKLNEREFESRANQFRALADYLVSLPESEHIVALGDFNTARIRGTGDETTQEEIEAVYTNEKGEKLLQTIYGYQKMKAELLERTKNTGRSLAVITPVGGLSSVGVRFQGGSAAPLQYQYHKYDHVITSLEGAAEPYDWTFLEHYSQEQFIQRQKSWEIKAGYPDHAILWAALELPQQDTDGSKRRSLEEQDCADAAQI